METKICNFFLKFFTKEMTVNAISQIKFIILVIEIKTICHQLKQRLKQRKRTRGKLKIDT